MSQLPNCPKCNSEFSYEDGDMLVCPDCAHEWNANAPATVTAEEGLIMRAQQINHDNPNSLKKRLAP